MRDGQLWLQAQEQTTALGPGDVVLVRGGTPVSFCAGPDGIAQPLAALRAAGPSTPGVQRLDLPGPGGPAVLLCGTYDLAGSVCDRLLQVLPAVAHVPSAPGPLAGVVQVLHADPAATWTVERLARAVGLSRAAFARRFTAAVGEPPLTYLSGWRIDLAKQALHRDGSTLASVAREVGYASEFALSAAFRRQVGEAPGRWRTRTH